jgi:hypothetical protein
MHSRAHSGPPTAIDWRYIDKIQAMGAKAAGEPALGTPADSNDVDFSCHSVGNPIGAVAERQQALADAPVAMKPGAFLHP